MRIYDYSLIESDQHAELVEAVYEAMKKHWQPLGGVCVWFEPTRLGDGIVHYAQAMVKYGA